MPFAFDLICFIFHPFFRGFTSGIRVFVPFELLDCCLLATWNTRVSVPKWNAIPRFVKDNYRELVIQNPVVKLLIVWNFHYICTYNDTIQNLEDMVKKNAIKIFEEKKVRTVWDSEREEWYFSIIDVIAILTESDNPRRYWSDLKRKLTKEGSQLYDKIVQLKLPASDGKSYLTDVADTQQLFRLIQSIPSPKAEPFKLWMAEVAKERLDQLQDPELSIEQAMLDYKRLGYSDSWINQRLKSIEIRKDLTDEWKRHGLQEGVHFAALTDIIYRTWAGKTAKEYKQFKGLKKENLRDNMTNKELVLNMLAELSTKEISEARNPQTFGQHAEVARRGGSVAREARERLEQETGQSVVSSLNAKQVLHLKSEE